MQKVSRNVMFKQNTHNGLIMLLGEKNSICSHSVLIYILNEIQLLQYILNYW